MWISKNRDPREQNNEAAQNQHYSCNLHRPEAIPQCLREAGILDKRSVVENPIGRRSDPLPARVDDHVDKA